VLYYETELVDADHLIGIQAKKDGLHISMTNHVKEVVKYKNGDVRVVGKPYSSDKPYYIHSGWDGFARIHNDITGEVEEFNTAQAYLNAAQAAGVTIRGEQ